MKCLHDENRGGVLCELPGGNCANCRWNPSVATVRHEKINHGAGLKNIDGLLRLCVTRTKRDTEKSAPVDKKKLAEMLRANKSAAEIATALGCAIGTVYWYRGKFKQEAT